MDRKALIFLCALSACSLEAGGSKEKSDRTSKSDESDQASESENGDQEAAPTDSAAHAGSDTSGDAEASSAKAAVTSAESASSSELPPVDGASKCSVDQDCNMKYVNCTGIDHASKASCDVEAARFICSPAADCINNSVLNGKAASCQAGLCVAVDINQADVGKSCPGSQPKDALCIESFCNNSAHTFVWLKPAEALKRVLDCKPCPNC